MPTDKRSRQKAARRAKIEAQRRAQKRQKQIRNVFVIVIGGALIVGSVVLFSLGGTTKKAAPAPGSQAALNALAVKAGCPAKPSAAANTLKWTSYPAMTISKKIFYYAHIQTTAGPIELRLDPKVAPLAVNNFVFLARHNYYNCNTFHRVIQTFMAQTGDPTQGGGGSPGYSFKDELPKKASPQYPLYSVAMANSGPNTNGSQFFIVGGPEGEGLTPNYTIFGKLISGISAFNAIMNDGQPSTSGGEGAKIFQRMLSVTISTKA